MKRLIVELTDKQYENIITLASANIGRFPYKAIVMYALNAIRRAEIIDDKTADEEATTKKDLGVDLPSVKPQEPKIKVLDRDEVIRKLGEVDVYTASAWVTLFKDLDYLGMKICKVEE